MPVPNSFFAKKVAYVLWFCSPERDLIRQQHEEIIQQLNKRMAEKAAKQITLNETRDKLRETNQKVSTQHVHVYLICRLNVLYRIPC